MNQLSTPNLEAQLIHVPIARLNPIAHGVRRTNGVDIKSLAASIAAEGLLQNLTVVRDASQPLAGAPEFEHYTVIAGSRRLKALRYLADQGKLPADYLVPCRLIEESQALTASLAENAIREPMHPADEFVAFRDMIDQGKSVDDIAARFGVTPQVVQRRLKLANVAPSLFEKFRNDKITLAQMMALAIVDDHAAQEKAWGKNKDDWSRAPERLREALTKGEIDAARDPSARFIGLQEYERAGGRVHRDLFDDKGGGYITDRRLLQELVTKKLAAVQERVRKEGWSFVEVRETLDEYGGELSEYSRAQPDGHRKPDDAEKKHIAALNAERKKLSERYEQLEGDNPEAAYTDEESAEIERIEARMEDTHAELESLEQARTKWDPKILAKGGAFIGLDRHSGAIRIFRGLVKGKLRQAKDAKAGKASSAGGETAKPGHSEALMRELSTSIGYAIGAQLIANPGMAVIALAHRLALSIIYDGNAGEWGDASDDPVKISTSQHGSHPRVENEVTSGAVDAVLLERERDTLTKLLPKKSEDLLAWLIDPKCGGAKSPIGGTSVTRVLAFCVAASINVVVGREDDDRANALAAALKLDMGPRWTARPDNYLTRVSSAHILAALKQAGADKTTLAKAAALKKGDLVTFAQPLLATWLPKPLRIGARS